MNSLKQTGLTLIEIMLTLAIVSTLATFAIPNVKSMLEANRTRTMINNLSSSLYLARSEAAKTGYNVTLCASNTDQTSCSDDRTYVNGWIIFRDYDGNRQLTPSSTLFDVDNNGIRDTPESILFTHAPSATQLVFRNNITNIQRVSYSPTGQAQLGAGTTNSFSIILHQTAGVGSANASNEVARLIVSMTGRVRSCYVAASGNCRP